MNMDGVEFLNMDDDDYKAIELMGASAAPDSVSLVTLDGEIFVHLWAEGLGEGFDFFLDTEKIDAIVLFLLTHKSKAVASAKGAAQ
jgi:hypothetical protein